MLNFIFRGYRSAIHKATNPGVSHVGHGTHVFSEFCMPRKKCLYKGSQKCETETSEIAQVGEAGMSDGEGMGKKQNTKTASIYLSVLGLLESFWGILKP